MKMKVWRICACAKDGLNIVSETVGQKEEKKMSPTECPTCQDPPGGSPLPEVFISA